MQLCGGGSVGERQGSCGKQSYKSVQACRVKSELQSFAGRPKNVVRKKNKSVIKHLSSPPM